MGTKGLTVYHKPQLRLLSSRAFVGTGAAVVISPSPVLVWLELASVVWLRYPPGGLSRELEIQGTYTDGEIKIKRKKETGKSCLPDADLIAIE